MKNIINIILTICIIVLLVFLVKMRYLNSAIEEPVKVYEEPIQFYNEEYDIIDDISKDTPDD